MTSSEGLLQILLTLVLAITAVNCQLYHGFDDDSVFLVELLPTFEMPDMMIGYQQQPSHHGYQVPKVRIVKKEEPFFHAPRHGRRNKRSQPPATRIESKAYAKKYFSHRRPRLARADDDTGVKMQMRRRPKESRSRNKRQAVKRRDDTVSGKSSGDLVWHWKGSNKKGRKVVRARPERRNRVGRPAISTKERISAQSFEEPSKRDKKKKRSEIPRDPLESPVIRLAVAVALGALVTCGVYAVATLIAMMFPSFFGQDEDEKGEEDILGAFSSTKPVRYVPVPMAPSSETSMI